MKIPETVKIGGHVYQVLFPYVFTERFDLYGQHDPEVKEIRVSARDVANQVRIDSAVFVTFIHEVLHAIDSITGHHVFKDNEKAIEGFSESIYQILVDNGWLIDEVPAQEGEQ